MADLTLAAQPRDVIGKQVNRLRKVGVLPAVVYGPALTGPRSIQLDYKTFESVYAHAGLSRLIALTIGEDGQAQPVFIRDVQYNLLKRRVDHVDFYAAQMDVETTASIQVVLVGEAPIVTRGEGVISQVLNAVTVRALPRAIPAHLEIDASRIKTFNDDVRVGDLSVPDGVSIVDSPDSVVISVTRSRGEEPTAEVEAPAAAEATGEPTGGEGAS